MAAQNFPFFQADVTKLMGEYKVPGMNVDALLQAQQRNIEAVTKANQLAFEGLQAVVTRQTEILKGVMEESSDTLNKLVAEGTPEEKVAQQADLVKDALEKALGNIKELSELVAKSNTEAAEVLSTRVSESLEEVKAAIEIAKKAA
ncbi:MAG: phasin family protein [Alphaproteobacteria bacterium]